MIRSHSIHSAVVLSVALVGLVAGARGAPSPDPAPDRSEAKGASDPVASYVERYLATFPSRATGAGLHDHDHRLEDLSPEARREWIDFNRSTLAEIRRRVSASGELTEAERLDLLLVERQAAETLFRWETLREPERDPLLWSGIVANATPSLLIRDDAPLESRLEAAALRVRAMPRLAEQARTALGETPAEEIAPDLARLAARQVRSTATFFRQGLAGAAPADGPLREELAAAGDHAAEALDELTAFLDELAVEASGSPRFGEHYPRLFAVATGIERPPDEILATAEEALEEKRREAADFGRSVWAEIVGVADPPSDDRVLLRELFRRIEADHAGDVEELVADYRSLAERSLAFVRERDVVTVPEPFDLWIGTSPDSFVGQSVGGVYPPGPFAPEAATLLFLPTPPSDATEEQRTELFRAFNHHFNVMITPHELVPGHALQLVTAARQRRKVRALFPDGVYVEGWGTFCERLMLDLGWGGPAARLAHLKKQLENIARTVVDIRVHTTDAEEDEIVVFLREEALQDPQLARNMWMRAITSSPQLTTYFLGYRQVTGLYRDVREDRGEAFDLKTFMDGMMELGPVPVEVYRERMLGER